MAELTAGYVAGLIAFVIVLVKVLCPTALSLILAGQVTDQETAGTWTAVARTLHSSFWPALLRSDPRNSHGVRKTVVCITWGFPFTSILIAIARVITPLGLYEVDEIATRPFRGTFSSVRDAGAFAAGTSPRKSEPFTRECAFGSCRGPCPYTDDDVLVWDRGGVSINCTDLENVNVTVPREVHDIYTSGTRYAHTTVSNFFDIQWRQLTTTFDRSLNNGTPIAVGAFRTLETFALDEQIRAVEGLIVDGRRGGIGFRNHTIPEHSGRGVQWTEDLLFLMPETECVDNGLTMDFGISTSLGGSSSSKIAVSNLVLTDRGGFASFNTTDPTEYEPHDEGNTPNLKSRAYQAAWGTTFHTMLYLNVTVRSNDSESGKPFERISSEIGKTFKLPKNGYDQAGYQSMAIDTLGYYLDVDGRSYLDDGLHENPWNITREDFLNVDAWCARTDRNNHVRLNNTYVACNQVRGVPRRVDDGPGTIFEDGSKWSAPLYSCASAIRATIRTVTFTHNGTRGSLEDLHIEEIKDKEYDSDSDTPLWGVEQWGYRLAGIDPVWGLVDPVFEGYPNVETFRAPSFYFLGSGMPDAFAQPLEDGKSLMNLPGAIAPVTALHTLTHPSPSLAGEDSGARSSMSLWLRYKELTSSEETMPTLFKVLWTDLAASAMVGSKGVLGPGNADAENGATVDIFPVVRRVKYHYIFAIPALMAALCLAVILLLLLASLLMGKSSVKIMDERLKQTSMGRVLTSLFYPEASSLSMSSKEWTDMNSKKPLFMGS
ncbi:hypothetical protein LIA77_10589 [Sarocladium implicatum]|nr:hypothetical protein LIA77_10589 [Sarocladium implicatum]